MQSVVFDKYLQVDTRTFDQVGIEPASGDLQYVVSPAISDDYDFYPYYFTRKGLPCGEDCKLPFAQLINYVPEMVSTTCSGTETHKCVERKRIYTGRGMPMYYTINHYKSVPYTRSGYRYVNSFPYYSQMFCSRNSLF